VNLVICDSTGYVIVSVAWCTYRSLKVEMIAHYDWGFLITLYACLIPHSFYMTRPLKSHLSSIILIICGGRYNLWSYTLCSFLQLPIIFSHTSLRTDQHCSQTQSAVYSQCHRTIVTPTVMKIIHKHTCMFISQWTWFQKAQRRAKYYATVVSFTPN